MTGGGGGAVSVAGAGTGGEGRDRGGAWPPSPATLTCPHRPLTPVHSTIPHAPHRSHSS